jgi:hypothetical protein
MAPPWLLLVAEAEIYCRKRRTKVVERSRVTECSTMPTALGCDKVIVYLPSDLRDGFHIDVKAVYQDFGDYICINHDGRKIQRNKRINNRIAAPAKQSQVTLSFQVTLESSAINSLSTSSSMSPSHRGPETFRCIVARMSIPRNPSAAIG